MLPKRSVVIAGTATNEQSASKWIPSGNVHWTVVHVNRYLKVIVVGQGVSARYAWQPVARRHALASCHDQGLRTCKPGVEGRCACFVVEQVRWPRRQFACACPLSLNLNMRIWQPKAPSVGRASGRLLHGGAPHGKSMATTDAERQTSRPTPLPVLCWAAYPRLH